MLGTWAVAGRSTCFCTRNARQHQPGRPQILRMIQRTGDQQRRRAYLIQSIV